MTKFQGMRHLKYAALSARKWLQDKGGTGTDADGDKTSSHRIYTETKIKQMPFCAYSYALIKNLEKIEKNVR